jgi:hypothetical protein
MEWSPGTDRSKPFCQVVQFISQKTHVFFLATWRTIQLWGYFGYWPIPNIALTYHHRYPSISLDLYLNIRDIMAMNWIWGMPFSIILVIVLK